MSKEKISKRSEKNLNEKNKIISEENKPPNDFEFNRNNEEKINKYKFSDKNENNDENTFKEIAINYKKSDKNENQNEKQFIYDNNDSLCKNNQIESKSNIQLLKELIKEKEVNFNSESEKTFIKDFNLMSDKLSNKTSNEKNDETINLNIINLDNLKEKESQEIIKNKQIIENNGSKTSIENIILKQDSDSTNIFPDKIDEERLKKKEFFEKKDKNEIDQDP